MNWPLAFFLVGSIASICAFMGWVVYVSARYTDEADE